MAGPGGYRPGSGAKKGQHRVHVKELRDAIEKAMGKPFQDVQAEVYVKLFNHFQNGQFVKEFIVYNENMSKRILTNPDNEETNDAIKSLTKEDLKAKIDNYLTRVAMSNPIDTVPTEIKDNQP